MAGRLDDNDEVDGVPHFSAPGVATIPKNPVVPRVLVLIQEFHDLFPGDIEDQHLALTGVVHPNIHAQLFLPGVEEVVVQVNHLVGSWCRSHRPGRRWGKGNGWRQGMG